MSGKKQVGAAGVGHRIGKVQQRILILMEERATEDGTVQISRAEIAEALGRSEDSIKWLMRSLKQRGLIDVIEPHTRGRNVGKPPVYRLTYMWRLHHGSRRS